MERMMERIKKKHILQSFARALILVCVLFFLTLPPQGTGTAAAPAAGPADQEPDDAAREPGLSGTAASGLAEERITSIPVRMFIPELSLDYRIASLGADSRGNMMIAPALEVVSWFNLSAIPGNIGNAILGGHNAWGGARSRLFNMDDLRVGSIMEIEYEDGAIRVFRLESVFVYPLLTAPAHIIMNVRGEARLTLITCKWPFSAAMGTSENRIVAIYKEESVFVIPVPPVLPFPPMEPPPEIPIPPHSMLFSKIAAE